MLQYIHMNTKNILITCVAFVLGVVGTAFFYEKDGERPLAREMHRMPDGSMMMNHNSASMESMMMDMTAGMRGKTGKELEKAFLTEMIPHHQGAVDMARLLVQNPNANPVLVKFGFDIINAQEKEIVQMREWLKEYR